MASCSAAEQNLYTLLSFRPTATTTRNTCSSRASLHPYLVRYTFPAFDWPRKKRRRRRKKERYDRVTRVHTLELNSPDRVWLSGTWLAMVEEASETFRSALRYLVRKRTRFTLRIVEIFIFPLLLFIYFVVPSPLF